MTTEPISADGELHEELEQIRAERRRDDLAAAMRTGVRYLILIVLAAIVLAPLYLTVLQALSPPLDYLREGKPLHPVNVTWKDRSWVSGGPVSVLGRTLVVVIALAFLQRGASPFDRWRAPGLLSPRRIASVVLGTIVLAVGSSLLWSSLLAADGRTAILAVATIGALAATQLIGYLEIEREHLGAVASAVGASLVTVAATVVFFGANVWTQSWAKADMGQAMARSFAMATAITVLQVLTAILAAYAFVFLRFPFKRLLFVVVIGTLLLPLEVTLLGNAATIRQFGWQDSIQGLVAPFAASAMGIFLIRQGFRGIPQDIRDATRLDGVGHVKFLFGWAVPLSRPVIASFTVIAALSAWNQYLWPRAITDQASANTMQIALRTIVQENLNDLNVPVAAALVSAVPVVILLIAFQRHIIRGLTAGAVK